MKVFQCSFIHSLHFYFPEDTLCNQHVACIC